MMLPRQMQGLALLVTVGLHACSGASNTSGGPQTAASMSSTAGPTDHAVVSDTTPPPPPPPPPPVQPTQPAQPAGPPPPRYTEVDAYLRSDPRGARCIQGNMIQADLTESFIDADLDGDGTPERVFQARDCLVVSARRGNHWDVISITPRAVARDVEEVTLRIAPTAGPRVVEVVDLRGTARETARFRWSGTELAPQ